MDKNLCAFALSGKANQGILPVDTNPSTPFTTTLDKFIGIWKLVQMIYSKKARTFDAAETTYEISGDTIIICVPNKPADKFAFTIRPSIHLSSLPQPNRNTKHQTVLISAGRLIKINNVHSDGIASFTARNTQYVNFIKAVMSAIHALHPESTVRIGPARIWYVMILLTLGIMFAGVIFLAFLGPMPLTAFSFSTQLKFALVVLLQPILIGWAIHSRPRTIPISEAVAACNQGEH